MACTVEVPSVLQGIEGLLSRRGYPFASNGAIFKSAFFGRDAIEVCEHLIDVRPDVVRATIVRLAELQGQRVDPRTEEEPGKIHHEHRALVLDGVPVDSEARTVFYRLVRAWNLSPDTALPQLREFTYYGTVDATPRFVRLVALYCARFGPEILEQPYTPQRTGEPVPLRESVRAALRWVAHTVSASPLGLLAARPTQPWSHPVQAWKDGAASYVHPTGEFVNVHGPVASMEVQGLAYDALTLASTLLGAEQTEERRTWYQLARQLQEAVLDLFWMPEERFFAMAVDQDPQSGAARQVRLLTTNPGAALNSGLLLNLDQNAYKQFVYPVADRLFSKEFLTDAGLRLTSLRHSGLLEYAAYQSSFTVWHKETFEVAAGFRRHGWTRLADDLETRMLNAINVCGRATEFLYVLPDGRVDYDPFDNHQVGGTELIGMDVPENDQAWSISAALAVKVRRGKQRPGLADRQDGFEEGVLTRQGQSAVLRTRAEVAAVREASARIWINRAEGRRREQAYLQRVSGR